MWLARNGRFSSAGEAFCIARRAAGTTLPGSHSPGANRPKPLAKFVALRVVGVLSEQTVYVLHSRVGLLWSKCAWAASGLFLRGMICGGICTSRRPATPNRRFPSIAPSQIRCYAIELANLLCCNGFHLLSRTPQANAQSDKRPGGGFPIAGQTPNFGSGRRVGRPDQRVRPVTDKRPDPIHDELSDEAKQRLAAIFAGCARATHPRTMAGPIARCGQASPVRTSSRRRPIEIIPLKG